MELEKEFKESAHKLIEGEKLTFLTIEFKVGLENCEVTAKGNPLGIILLESLGVDQHELKGLLKEMQPATSQFNKKLAELLKEKDKQQFAEFKEKHNG